MSVISLSVEVGRYGRIILPKDLREKYGVEEGSKLILRGIKGRSILVPVKTYEKPTDALYGSIRLEKPLEEPKDVARAHIRKKLTEDLK